MKEKKSQAKIIKRLASDCLKFKWIKEQKRNLERVLSPCAFCLFIKSANKSCASCMIDKQICNNNGNGGLIGYIVSKYGNIFLKDIDYEDYNLVRIALKELKSEGYISKELTLKIQKMTRL